MDDEIITSLIRKYRKSKTCSIEKATFQSPHRQSVRIRQQSQKQFEQLSRNSVESSALEWQHSDELQPLPLPSPQKSIKPSNHSNISQRAWYGSEQKLPERTLNDKFFNLSPKVQKIIYLINYIINMLIRIMFINLLVFLGLQNKWIYIQIFMSLEATAVIMYLIVMVKMLFTRSDKESVYFQKIFNQAEWADIEQRRLMRTHFNVSKIVSKICVFFNPFTKFKNNTKISFLRQELFKRMELVMVYIPFTILFLIRPNNFISDSRPNFNVFITAGIVIQSTRTALTYLIVYIYN